MAYTTNNQIVPVDEEKELTETKIEVAKGYYLTPKYKLWESYFFDKKNKATFGNATMSACMAYGLDPEDPKAYSIAGAMGCKNKKKVKDLRKRYWEARGLTEGKLLDLYNTMMVERRDINLLYSVAEDMGVELPDYKQVVGPKVMNQNNTQVNGDVQISFSAIEEK